MRNAAKIAIIGSGASGIYVLRHILTNANRLGPVVEQFLVFERDAVMGTGMPYSRRTTDRYNLCNISSAEIPKLDRSLVDWLESLDDAALAKHHIERDEIDDGETYSRLALGEYFQSQYRSITDQLKEAGIHVIDHASCEVVDVVDSSGEGGVSIKTANGESFTVDRLIIATGHAFHEDDEAESGYFASPWPMQKLLPRDNGVHDFTIGTLGASLSAYDVVASLSHRHGRFESDGGKLKFVANDNAKDFHIMMHSSNGWLPHLQYEQDEPFREIYRHTTREQMLGLRDRNQRLSLDDFFNSVCRSALSKAFSKDKRPDIVEMLNDLAFTLSDFAEQMTSEHEYDDPFDGMRAEMPEAEHSIRRGKPIHWKEVLDDLMFTLNFHFEWLYAEDVLQYRTTVVPFLMNVIAAMPLPSARTLLALYDAGHLDLVPGRVIIKNKTEGETVVEVDNEGAATEVSYKMFVDCTGQGSVELGQFPFPSLLQSGAVSEASAPLRDRNSIQTIDEPSRDKLTVTPTETRLRLGGIAIDGYYRIVGSDGEANPRIFDIAFPHATGVRPYSYGLQACNTTAAIVVDTLCNILAADSLPHAAPEAVTQAYGDLPKSA